MACPYRLVSSFTSFRWLSYPHCCRLWVFCRLRVLIRMLSAGLETFTIELLSTSFNPLPFVWRHCFTEHIRCYPQTPQFLGIMWRMRKQSIPGPSSVRPGIEASCRYAQNDNGIIFVYYASVRSCMHWNHMLVWNWELLCACVFVLLCNSFYRLLITTASLFLRF